MKKPETRPWAPAKAELPDTVALQALSNGTADEHQQKRALKWIIEVSAGTYDQQFYPGDDGRRDTDFALGRRYVGLSIVKELRLNVSELRRREENA